MKVRPILFFVFAFMARARAAVAENRVKVRPILFFVFVAVFSLAYSAGAATEVSEEEARLFMEQFEELVGGIDGFGIFSHNAVLALPMFIPGFGVGWGLFSAWSTGVAFSAITTVTPELESIPPLAILYFSPFGLMELTAYSLGISRSFMLIYAIVKRVSPKPQLRAAAVEVGVVLALLLAGGYLEFYMIEAALESNPDLPGLFDGA